MDQDIRCRRAEFIGNTTDVRTMFSFAQPNQIIQAVTTYCFSIHNCMYWPLFSDMAKQFFKCWFTCVKLTWDADSATKSYFVDNLLSVLSGGLPSMRASVLACYGNFYHGVSHSTALEVRTLACLAAADVRSVIGSNLRNLTAETGLDPRKDVLKLRKAILDSKCPVPEMDTWRIPFLKKYLALRYRMDLQGEDKGVVEDLILFLVTT